MTGRGRAEPGGLGSLTVRACILAVLALLLVLAHARSKEPAPRTQETPEPPRATTRQASLTMLAGPLRALGVSASFPDPQPATPASTPLPEPAPPALTPQQAVEAAIVQALIEALADTADAIRQEAAEALGERGTVAAVPALVGALADPQRRVREQVAEALGEIGDPGAVPALGQALASDASDNVAEAAAEALGRIATADAASQLERALLSPRDESFRRVVVGALGRTGQPSAVELLEGFLPLADRRLQQTILQALVASGTEPALQAVLRAARSGDESLRLMAIRALGR